MLAKYQGRQWTFVFLVAFLASAFLSSLFAVNITNSIHIFISYFAGGVVLYLSYKIAQNDKYRKYAEWFLYLIIVYALVIAVFALYQKFAMQIQRPRSIVGGANLAARYIELAIPVILSFLLSFQSSLKQRVLLGIGLVTFLGALIVTQSRGAILAILIVIIFIMLLYKSYRVLATTVILTPLIFYLEKSSLNRLLITSKTEASSNIERINVWKSSLQIVHDYPLTGIGFGNFEQMYTQYISPSAKVVLPHAHNILLVFASEAGLFTAIFFVMFIVSAALVLYKGIQHMDKGYYRSLVIGMCCGAVAILTNGMVDHSFHQPAIWIFLLFEIGFCLGLLKRFRCIK